MEITFIIVVGIIVFVSLYDAYKEGQEPRPYKEVLKKQKKC
jgi:hypothetical protein